MSMGIGRDDPKARRHGTVRIFLGERAAIEASGLPGGEVYCVEVQVGDTKNGVYLGREESVILLQSLIDFLTLSHAWGKGDDIMWNDDGSCRLCRRDPYPNG